jgi:hypothetical protein
VNVIRANREVDLGYRELFDPDFHKFRHDWHYAVATLWYVPRQYRNNFYLVLELILTTLSQPFTPLLERYVF